MTSRQKELFELCHSFHKLNIASLFPPMPQSEHMLLGAIQECKKRNKADKVLVSEIVNTLCISAPAVSRTLKNLEEKGFITRQVNEKDRRNTYVMVTPLGDETREECNRILSDYSEAVLAQMPEGEMEQLLISIRRLRDIAESEIQIRKYIAERKSDIEENI